MASSGGAQVAGRIGDRLIDRGVLTEEQLGVALREQKRFHRPLGEILLSLGFVSESDIAALVAQDLGIELLEPQDIQPDPLVVSQVDAAFVRETMAFPYRIEDGVLHVVMANPDDSVARAVLRERFSQPIVAAIMTSADIHALIHSHLSTTTTLVANLLASLDGVSPDAFPIEEIVEAVIADGIHRGATDIHIEPEERVTRVRYRVDGILQGGENLPTSITSPIISRIKVLSHLDIAERRRPQDGRMRMHLDDRRFDMRVSLMPSNNGENVVLRVLDGSSGVPNLARLGISDTHQKVLRNVISRSHGLFLVTGPTGSGKTTTLYSLLAEIDAVHRKVATVEDPIEYQLPLLRQTQVDPSIGFDFGSGLRSLLRQDPDVILVGEIRDAETADMAIKAAMTGHLVFSTLHTNSAIGAFPRLVDMGIEPFLLEDAVIGTMSQRLLRRICTTCKQEAPPSEKELAWLGGEVGMLQRGAGCERCEGRGFRGRISAVEMFLPEPELLADLRNGVALDAVEAKAAAGGFRSLEEDGKRLVRAGITTMDEVLRVSRGIRLTRDERESI
ncbi:MAG TPA: type II/IV secretion system protein [Planctomycetes bacterium]|nr:type II/IV secretion system protein [Planctomycetota bacterium]